MAITKGAVDGWLDIANRVWVDGHTEPLAQAWRERIEKANAELARNGMRVLGVAFRHLDWDARTADQTVKEEDEVKRSFPRAPHATDKADHDVRGA